MARYDVYQAPDGQGLLLDVQSELLERLNTRVVVPLMLFDVAPRPADRLNPIFSFDQDRYVMLTQYLSSVPVTILDSPIDNFEVHHIEIVSAVDMLMHGY